MAQHFLLSTKAKTLSLKKIFRMSDQEAFDYFKSIRWAENDGNPICYKCGNYEKFWFISTRQNWKCAYCKNTFTVTSGTLFAYHKLPLRDYLAAIAIFTNGAKGINALHLSRDLQVQYKTAFVLAHKIREALQQTKETKMKGEVEIDGAYFGGFIKPKNIKAERLDRRLVENKNDKKQCVIALKLRGLEQGSIETRTAIIKQENYQDIKSILETHVDPSSIIHSDEHPSYDRLASSYILKQVNHKIQYSDRITGACTNQAESFFSRIRRAEIGINHHFAGKYLYSYANEMAYREDHCRMDNGWMYQDIVSKALHKNESKIWKGYWQRSVEKRNLI
ncbi:MAG TPA: IS1595 family transposase [Chitinophagales bacterium]|nr:IS1595 family transposase [Chitinophagales bacterium]HMW93485.1 IS1595 family transposase [Chitinophagales bacterium]HMZ92892.1 IS1595 family transposase [Chitinophagales bacterium]HNG25919.1 IS1595 family transposase [Chitinophagales bacterium]